MIAAAIVAAIILIILTITEDPHIDDDPIGEIDQTMWRDRGDECDCAVCS